MVSYRSVNLSGLSVDTIVVATRIAISGIADEVPQTVGGIAIEAVLDSIPYRKHGPEPEHASFDIRIPGRCRGEYPFVEEKCYQETEVFGGLKSQVERRMLENCAHGVLCRERDRIAPCLRKSEARND